MLRLRDGSSWVLPPLPEMRVRLRAPHGRATRCRAQPCRAHERHSCRGTGGDTPRDRSAAQHGRADRCVIDHHGRTGRDRAVGSRRAVRRARPGPDRPERRPRPDGKRMPLPWPGRRRGDALHVRFPRSSMSCRRQGREDLPAASGRVLPVRNLPDMSPLPGIGHRRGPCCVRRPVASRPNGDRRPPARPVGCRHTSISVRPRPTASTADPSSGGTRRPSGPGTDRGLGHRHTARTACLPGDRRTEFESDTCTDNRRDANADDMTFAPVRRESRHVGSCGQVYGQPATNVGASCGAGATRTGDG